MMRSAGHQEEHKFGFQREETAELQQEKQDARESTLSLAETTTMST